MKIFQLEVGAMQNFTYVLEDEQTGKSIVIDPSWDLDKVKEVVEKNDMQVEYIVNTHHHFDHTMGNETLTNYFGSKVVQHVDSPLKEDVSVKDGEDIKFGNCTLRVIHTPGHSKDSICLLGEGCLFTGDTLFVGNCGRVDLPGGSAKDLYYSLFNVLMKLDKSLVIYPGHNYGDIKTSTLDNETKTNFVLKPRTEDEFLQFMNSED